MDRLSRFYHSYFSPEIEFLEDAALPLSKDIPVFDSTKWGHAMKYLSLFERSGYSVYLLPATAPVTNIAALNNSKEYFYTINTPFPDTKTEKVYEADALGRRLTIYKNSAKPWPREIQKSRANFQSVQMTFCSFVSWPLWRSNFFLTLKTICVLFRDLYRSVWAFSDSCGTSLRDKKTHAFIRHNCLYLIWQWSNKWYTIFYQGINRQRTQLWSNVT